jgi:predicted nucleic acid-binding protein
MMYLLDTNILSELLKRQPNPGFVARLASKPAQWMFTSCICVMELRFGSALREDFEPFWTRISEEILSRVNILPLNLAEVIIAGDILAFLRRTGQPVAIEDALIGATALNHQCTLVTANTRHFANIGHLPLENWLEEGGE